MPAYIVSEIDVTDPAGYEPYKVLAQEAIAKYGGKYAARGGKTVALEGDKPKGRIVVLQFDSLAAAEKFYYSPEYQKALVARQKASTARLYIVEG